MNQRGRRKNKEMGQKKRERKKFANSKSERF